MRTEEQVVIMALRSFDALREGWSPNAIEAFYLKEGRKRDAAFIKRIIRLTVREMKELNETFASV